MDVNTNANAVYNHNFPLTTAFSRNIESITAAEIDKFSPDMILMSPPCQPFTRVGLKKDVADQRSSALCHIISLIPNLSPTLHYILLENVKGFEESEARHQLMEILRCEGFTVQEFLLSPVQFSIPNSRLRYYMLAKRLPLKFCFQTQPFVMQEFPTSLDNGKTSNEILRTLNSRIKSMAEEDGLAQNEESEQSGVSSTHSFCYCISRILETTDPLSEKYITNLLPEEVLGKRSMVLDIVNPHSKRSCCFTKAYGHYSDGTGSVLTHWKMSDVQELRVRNRLLEVGSKAQINEMTSLRLRYFTPREVARLMCFPEEKGFSFPPEITTKQKYKLLGNSINVHVVALLISLMLAGDDREVCIAQLCPK